MWGITLSGPLNIIALVGRYPLNPINPDNARILRITAAAGTELADAYSQGTFSYVLVHSFIPLTELYNPKAFITHAALLVQAFAH